MPTPYVVKMALLDAGLRSGRLATEKEINAFVKQLASMQVRIGVPTQAVVTHTIVKVRQEPKEPKPGLPYVANVAYREFVHFKDQLSVAIDTHEAGGDLSSAVSELMPLVTYFGKRASFVQYLRSETVDALPHGFTVPLADLETIPTGVHIAVLDDFGPDVDFEVLNSYSTRKKMKRDRHRRFVKTIVPLGLVRSGPGFTEYKFAS